MGIKLEIYPAYLITLASLITTALDNTTSAMENDRWALHLSSAFRISFSCFAE